MEGIFEDFVGHVHNTPTQAGSPCFALASSTFAAHNFQKTPSGAQIPPLTFGWNLHQFLISE